MVHIGSFGAALLVALLASLLPALAFPQHWRLLVDSYRGATW